jgi:hypothetical protein
MPQADEPLDRLVAHMNPSQRAAFVNATGLQKPAPPAVVAARRVRTELAGPVPTQAMARARAATAPDPTKELKERTLARGFRTAFGGQVPMDVVHMAFGPSPPAATVTALTWAAS